MKIVLALFMGLLFVISFNSFALANLTINIDLNPRVVSEKSDLFCGLALPVEGGQGSQGEDNAATDDDDNKDDTQQGQDDNSGSETDSGSQSDQED